MYCPKCGKEMKRIETNTYETKFYYCENCKILYRYHVNRLSLEELW